MAQRPWPELRAKMVLPGAQGPAPLLRRAHSLGAGEESSERTQHAEPRGEQGRGNVARGCPGCARCGRRMDGAGRRGHGRSGRRNGALGPRAAPRAVTAGLPHPPAGRPCRPGRQGAQPAPHGSPSHKRPARPSCAASRSGGKSRPLRGVTGRALSHSITIGWATDGGSYWLIAGCVRRECPSEIRDPSFRFLERGAEPAGGGVGGAGRPGAKVRVPGFPVCAPSLQRSQEATCAVFTLSGQRR